MDPATIERWQHKALEDGIIETANPTTLYDILEPIGHGATADIVKVLNPCSFLFLFLFVTV